jgi:hypothetical protein
MDKAMGNLGYAREPYDLYETPEWCTRVLVPYLPKDTMIWEPACGHLAITMALSKLGYKLCSTDIQMGIDFLKSEILWDVIVTNPPYSLAEEFVRHALPARFVAMLLRNEWDCAKTRNDLFKWPFSKKIVLTSRPRWIKGSTGAPRHNYAWYVWDRTYDSDLLPSIHYGHKDV